MKSVVRKFGLAHEFGPRYCWYAAGLHVAPAQRLGGNERPLGDTQMHVAAISDPVIGHVQPVVGSEGN